MIVAGCDVGSLTAKAVILGNRRILAFEVIRSGFRPEESAKEVMEKALEKANITMDQVGYCVGTGYGRERMTFVDKVASEIACHAKGARWLIPSVRTVIDIGGQDCKAMHLDRDGNIIKFVTNDKCAAGTGRFLEVMAKALGVGLEELGLLSDRARNPLVLASTCTVWAQAEVIHHLNAKKPLEDIGAAVNQAMAKRVSIMANAAGVERDLCITGGVAKNKGVVTALEKLLGMRTKRARVDPQIIGALGAAAMAWESVS